MMRLILVRHAEKTNPAKGKPHLTKKGHIQAKNLGKRLKSFKIDYIYSSDLLRAKETLSYIKKHHKVPVIVTSAFEELDDSVVDTPKAKLGRWKKKMDRAFKALDRIISRHENETVLVLCHGILIKCFIAHLLKLDHRKGKHFHTSFTSIHIAEINGRDVKFCAINDINHLPRNMITEEYMKFD
ncbi:histidine phosphatase family protein [Candidatus Woesearchaeota archaeon]|nr:MAG: histidine phosphatase family protein [Candidatus Woesearchaeota archaeon]